MIRLLADLGDPHLHLPPVIHVAGTNGKGSCCAFLRAIAEAAGLRVHVYTSPHLVRFNERIRLAGELVSDAALAAALDEIEAKNAGNQITVFEAITAAAFLLFSRVPADLCVLEVGLGGKFDATNVIAAPLVAAITSISLDHQDFLGDRISVIAAEKAGIIKPGTVAVTGHQAPEALVEIFAAAAASGVQILTRGRDWSVVETPDGLVFNGELLPRPALLGAHQADNAGIAIAALRASDLHIPDAAYGAGLQRAEWPARLQKLSGSLCAMLPPGSELWLAAPIIRPRRRLGHPARRMARPNDADRRHEAIQRPSLNFWRPWSPGPPRFSRSPNLASTWPCPSRPSSPPPARRLSPAPTSPAPCARSTPATRILICGSLYLAGEVLKLDQAVPQPSTRL